MNWKKWTALLVGTLFIIGNLYLIFKKDSQINRLSYVDTWTYVKVQNLVESKADVGLMSPEEEEYIYYEPNTGDFKAFLVKEGDQVEEDTPILELSSVNIDAAISQKELEISKLEDEIDALEDNIDSLDDLLRNIEKTTTEENESSNSLMANSLEIEIYEKELQLSRLEAELDKEEEQLDSMDNSLTSLTINSTLSGKVKEIRHDLSNPVVTITSNNLQVEATLSEKELTEFEEGMKVYVKSHLQKGKLEGTVSSIAAVPKSEPKETKETQYTYKIQLSEQPGTSIPLGSHVDLTIITNEITDALTISKTAVRNRGDQPFVYVMMANGTIERRPIDTGLTLNHVKEIKSNMEKDEKVVLTGSTLRDESKFFTSLHLKKLNKKPFIEMGEKKALKTVLKGFVTN